MPRSSIRSSSRDARWKPMLNLLCSMDVDACPRSATHRTASSHIGSDSSDSSRISSRSIAAAAGSRVYSGSASFRQCSQIAAISCSET
ncbi:MAG: hypothetical protein AKCLJLPJ_02472 [Fimbriimonadales bacterium]|nr:hypothetical protein [Fimbriimonadales bacterium]